MAGRLELGTQVCVIGAGCAGLTMIKALREAGIAHLCFEMSDRVGGNWVFGNKNGQSGAYRSLHSNTSRRRMEFQDFPMPAHVGDFPHHRHLAEYFEGYARRFRLHESVLFEHEVLQCEPLPASPQPATTASAKAPARDGGGWSVLVRDRKTGRMREYTFGAVLVANGHHWHPALPDPPVSGSFGGVVLHSHAYIDPSTPVDLRGKRVVVVGIGNSAVDIASELCRAGAADRVFLSSRRGAWVLPKYVRGRPLDEASFFPTWLPPKLRRHLMTRTFTLLYGRMSDYGLPEPDHLLGEAHPTVSSELLSLVGSGSIHPKPAMTRLSMGQVFFADGTSEQVDAIVYCTGYHVTFPFFSEGVLSAPENRLEAFFRVFEPNYRGLCLLGFVQPLGAINPIVEQQSRWVAEYLSGRYSLPSLPEMERAIEEDHRWINERFVPSRRHTLQIDPERYLKELAKERSRGRRRAATGIGRRFRTTMESCHVEHPPEGREGSHGGCHGALP